MGKKFDIRLFMYNLLDNEFDKMGIKEVIMFNVSEKASEMIKDFLKDKEDNTNIRVFLSQGG